MAILSNTTRLLARILAAVGLSPTIVSPVSGATVTNAAFSVVWMFSPGTQQTYEVVIYSDAAGTVVAYDSGVVTSAIMFHGVPAGALATGQTYYAQVFVSTTLAPGILGYSPLSQFLTAFAPSTATLAGLTVTALGGGCDGLSADTLPGFQVKWTQVVPGGGETFKEYDVQKRKSGTTMWTVKARITAVGTVTYTDYEVAPGTEYEYSVVWQATTASGTLVSLVQNPTKKGILIFPWSFVHVIGTPATYIRLFNFDPTEKRPQDITYEAQWGATAKTRYVGELDYRTVSVPTLPELLASGLDWTAVEALLAAQMAGGVFCVRFGRARLMLLGAGIDSGTTRRMSQKASAADLAFTELDYTEVV